MKSYFRRIISMILVIATIANISLTGFAETTGGEQRSSGDVFSFAKEVTWAEAAKQIAGMLSFIVECSEDVVRVEYKNEGSMPFDFELRLIDARKFVINERK